MSWSFKSMRASINSMFDDFEKMEGEFDKAILDLEKHLESSSDGEVIERETRPDGTHIVRRIVRRTVRK